MAIGTGLAIGLGLAASAGTQIAGAKMASNASKDAARLQTQSADRAMGTMRDIYGPYMAHGQSTLNTLGRLTAAPAGARFAAPMPTASPASPPRAEPRPAGFGRQPATMRDLAIGGGMVPPAGGGLIRLRAPDGSERDVPSHLADRFLARGAQRV